MTRNTDIAVIGAGLVGLSIARSLLEAGFGGSLTVLDKEREVSTHQSGNNSGVLHSGVYYKPGSEKARNCVEGYGLLLKYCREKNIPHRLVGKLIVAKNEKELASLEMLKARGEANGLSDLDLLTPAQFQQIEPIAVGAGALRVPQAGIVDYKAVAKSLRREIEAAGHHVMLSGEVLGIELQTDDSRLLSISGGQSLSAKLIINCAGLHCDRIARLDGVDPEMQIVPFRGEYYDLVPAAAERVHGLIYPVPDPDFPFLGVHLTRMMSGGVEAGPNAVLAFGREAYKNHQYDRKDFAETLGFSGFRTLSARHWRQGAAEMLRSYSKRHFVQAVQVLAPSLNASDFVKGGAGIRAQALRADGSLVDDFYIKNSANAIHVLNAPSPAATSCLAIGRHIASLATSQVAA